MCLGVPGRITEIYEKSGMMMGKVDFGGVTRETCLDFVPEAQIGDYTVIHVGFAISLLSEEEAQKTLEMLREIDAIGEELGLYDEPQVGHGEQAA
ncbi:MAG TPA: hydrogenase assembly protein HypC [Chloroflexi bacterium]|nr:hydrogenase assembly protein HypC [Chloroflexota bacterium]HBY06991.1 hydrogenase assembly protein HypC [Chloroflexota bacterium]